MTLETDVGYQAWEVLLKLPEPDLSMALDIARNLNFDMEMMCELLPVGIAGMVSSLRKNKE